MLVIHSLADIPEFETEAEEAAYWDIHMMSPNLARSLPTDEGELPPIRSRPQYLEPLSRRHSDRE